MAPNPAIIGCRTHTHIRSNMEQLRELSSPYHGVITRSIDWNVRYNGGDVDDDTDVIIGRAKWRVLAVVQDSLREHKI